MEFEPVWTAYRARLKAFLHARVSNPADVDDLLQDISLKVHAGLGGLARAESLKPWLFQTAQNAITDHYRKSARRPDPHPDDLWYAPDDPQLRQELEACVAPFIAARDADSAALLRAVELDGQSQRAFAADLGLPYSTLKSRVQTARARLRDLFDECCSVTLDARGNIADYDTIPERCEKC